jgi:DNA-binding CsgD family transcriptional regulator
MSEAVRFASLRAERDAPVLPIESSDLLRLRAALQVLVSPETGGQFDHWRRSVLHSVRKLIQADKGALILCLPGGPVVYAAGIGQDALDGYLSRTAVDHRRAGARRLGTEVWSLHDTVGITLHLPQQQADVSLYLHPERTGSPTLIKHRQTLLEVILPAFRAAFETHLGAGDTLEHLASFMDVTGQALALCYLDGRELRHNPVMLRVLAQDPECHRLQACVREVAGAVLATLVNGNGTGPATRADGTRREVATSMAAYRLRGNPVGRDPLGHSTAVLVSVDRVAFETPAPESLRERYRLTGRELQVASLLMHRLSNAEIARVLRISPHTARHHTESVLLKFGVRSRAAVRRLISGEPPS